MTKYFLTLLILLFFSISCWSKTKIFLLSSYDEVDVCGMQQYNGVVNVLRLNLLSNFSLKSFWLDSRHLNKKLLGLRIKKAVSLIKKFSPDILIAIDDIAFKVALDNFLGNKKINIVFTGVNKPLNLYNNTYHFLDKKIPIKNVTGVYENLFVKKAIQFIDNWIEDESYKIAVLYSTDIIGTILFNQMKNELKNSPFLKRIVAFQVSTYRDLKSVVNKIKLDTHIKVYCPYTMKIWNEKDKKYLSFTELIPFFKKNLSIPEIFPNTAVANKGFLGGVGNDFYKMGEQAAQMAVAIINGLPLKFLPVQNSKNFKILINLKRAKKCQLPLDSFIIYTSDEIVRN